MNGYTIFSGNSNPRLARNIAQHLGVQLGNAKFGKFSDGETSVEIGDNVRGVEVYVVQATCAPTDRHLMEILIAADALKRASAGSITAVMPYFGYARQDRKARPRTPITAKLVADLLQTAGVSRIVTVDVHAEQIQGFFDIPFDSLYARPEFLKHLKDRSRRLAVVSPDAGGVERARAYAKRLNASLVIIDKRRPKAGVSEVLHIIGSVKGRDCIIVDDIIDTAGTVTNAASALMRKGAASVMVAATHAVLSGPAIERIKKSALTEVLVTDTIPLTRRAKETGKFTVIGVGELLGEAIRRIHNGESISALFK